ncbi:hypothetical protein Nepgr_000302 [Nepenthes gracilis]|uniref:Uncharacterized protein n=1 Tax=Nepenthes gracilis TaxID=150966 RepID=A0AAD3P514_NEPGR|nr:hypothetical protein Nepgr_000302 [Nepenthes gracilis]
MVRAPVQLGGACIALLLLAAAVAEAAATTPAVKAVKHKPKKVKCKDKKSACYHKDLFCPASCPRTCVVDCSSCQPVCTPLQPSPPPSPKNPKKHAARSPPSHSSSPPPASVAKHPPPPPSSTPTPTLPSGGGAKKVRCMDEKKTSCYFRQFTCPATCPQSCDVNCDTCRPVCSCDRPGAVCQDPRFIGADGLTFYFHGKRDRDFCLVTDSNLHINAHFIGKRNDGMRRDFTWVQSLGILFDSHQLYVGARRTATWNDAVDRLDLSFDGEPIFLPESEGARWQSDSSPPVTVTRSQNTNVVSLEAEGNFRIKAAVVPITQKDSMIHKYGITEEDCFAHLDLSFKFYSLSGDVNGVLGQTYASSYVSRVKMGVQMPVLGGDKEFSSSSLFAADCAVARFAGEGNNTASQIFEFDDLDCAGGISGGGVVCKR